MKTFYQYITDYLRKVNWILLVFLVLVLNVKLVIKLVAIVLIALWKWRSLSWKNIFSQRQLYFYLSVVALALLNFLLHVKDSPANYVFTVSLGVGFWLLAAAVSYHLFLIVKTEPKEKLYATITLFFILHIGTVFLNLARIMIECGTINPYTYKGFNQKYYISTGDYISGITFDSPVTTAVISAFALLYFLYRRHFFLSLAATASQAMIGSNLTNIFLVLVLLFVFIFHSSRIQKSIVILQLCVLTIFIVNISPKDKEYLGRVLYAIAGKPYDLPKKNESIDFIKVQPDSLLDFTEIKKKRAQLYLDSVSAGIIALKENPVPINTILIKKEISITDKKKYEFREPPAVAEKINRHQAFINQHYTAAEKDSLNSSYDWKKPGKWIAYQQVYLFLKTHPSSLLLGTGAGNFSSRTAFKVTALGMAGAYPKKYKYIHPWFHKNHLYNFLYYHSQDQMKHAAANTPDSTYSQLLSEYGLAGFIAFIVLYLGHFIRRIRHLTFGLPILLLLLAVFSVEYWFEQLSVVVLFEVLLFIDMKPDHPGSRLHDEEEALP